MNIVFCCDENYMGLLATTILSLLENKGVDDDIKLFVFDDGIKDESKRKMNEILVRFNQMITYMPVPTVKEIVGIEFPLQRWSTTMMPRLFAGSLFASEITRIIFMDCDLLILGSLKELWEMDLKGHIIGGVLECTGDKRKRNLGLLPNDVYINAGVELIDLKALRESDSEERYRRFMRKNNGYIPEVEQGTANACNSKNILPVHPKWNAHTTFFMFDYDTQRKIKSPTVYPTRKEVDEAINNPVIVHFSGCCFSDIRPWQGGSSHPYAEEFMQYKARTPWNNPLYTGDNRSVFMKICNWCYRRLPKALYSSLMAFGHYIILKVEARKVKRARAGKE